MRIQQTTSTPLIATTPKSTAPAQAAAPADKVVLNSDKTLPKWALRRPLHAAAGATTGAILGAGLGSLIHSGPVAAGIGGTLGAALGTYVGNVADHWAYSVKAKLRELENKTDQRKAESAQAHVGTSDGRNFKPLGLANQVGARAAGQSPRNYDGCDSSRDIVGLYAAEQKPSEPYRIDVEVAHLRPAAEHGHLDTTLNLAWGEKGKMALRVEDDKNIKLNAQPAGDAVRAHHSTVFNRVEVEIDKSALRAAGWQDGQALRLEASTSVDGSDQVSSSLKADTTQRADGSKIFRWEGKTVYYAVTDRFHNGDLSNDGPRTDKNNPDRFHGGDWQGVIDKLDYLKDLNVDCVWLSPPYEQQRDFTNVNGWNGDGYHGYWPMNFEKPDPNWGDRAKLQELVSKAHERGMKVMLDVVLNHTGYDHEFAKDPTKKDWFHANGNNDGLGQWNMDEQALAGLPDLAQENPAVTDYLVGVHKDWLKDVDAFRLDAIRHMPEKFLREFNDKMREEKPGYYSVGEAFWPHSNFVANYQNRTTEGMFDFPLAYAVRKTFAGDESRTLGDRIDLYKKLKGCNQYEGLRELQTGHKSNSMKLISDVLKNDRLYDNPAKLGTFIDNHDMVRFASDIGGDESRMEGALAFLFAVRGTPHVYYGTEVAMTGIGDENRKDMEFDSNPAMQATFKKLSGARHSSFALQTGSQQELAVGKDTYAFSRMRPDEEVVCVFNKGDEPQTLSFPLHEESPIPEGSRLKEMFGGQDVVVKDGAVTVTLPPKGYSYLQWGGAAGNT